MDYFGTELLAVGALAALLTGIAKSGVPGLGILVVPVMAMVLPAKASVGALLPILITGDVVAIVLYRRHAQWNQLRGLFVWVVLGMAGAGVALGRMDDAMVRPLLGGLVLAMTAMELARRRMRWDRLPHHPVVVAGTGVAAGFSTTMGNAAGPIMNMYLLARDLPKEQFVGTAAWFFCLVNLAKLPIFVWRGMITPQSLLYNLALVPVVLLGAAIGFKILNRIPQRAFFAIVTALTIIASLRLMGVF